MTKEGNFRSIFSNAKCFIIEQTTRMHMFKILYMLIHEIFSLICFLPTAHERVFSNMTSLIFRWPCNSIPSLNLNFIVLVLKKMHFERLFKISFYSKFEIHVLHIICMSIPNMLVHEAVCDNFFYKLCVHGWKCVHLGPFLRYELLFYLFINQFIL